MRYDAGSRRTDEAGLENRILAAKEVARHLGIGVRTLYRWVRAGRVPPPLRFTNRTLRWELATIKEFLASKKV
jgi:excisionase family DNA binding protein